MEISVKLLKYKNHIAGLIAASLFMTIFVTMAPDAVIILYYFWPLFLSTTLLLVAMAVFNKSTTDSNGDGYGQGLLDFVAGRPEMLEGY